jgi:hypothetical protein
MNVKYIQILLFSISSDIVMEALFSFCSLKFNWNYKPKAPQKINISHLKRIAYLNELFESFSVVDVANLLAEDAVEQQGDGVGERRRDDHEQFGDVDGARANGEAVTRADGLRHNLAKYDNGHCRADHGEQSGCQVVDQNGQGRVHQHITCTDAVLFESAFWNLSQGQH